MAEQLTVEKPSVSKVAVIGYLVLACTVWVGVVGIVYDHPAPQTLVQSHMQDMLSAGNENCFLQTSFV